MWDWRDNKKLATLFLVVDGWIWVNHLTHHWSGTCEPQQYLWTDFEQPHGRVAPVTLREYEQGGSRWTNNPKKAGLDIEMRNRKFTEKAIAE